MSHVSGDCHIAPDVADADAVADAVAATAVAAVSVGCCLLLLVPFI